MAFNIDAFVRDIRENMYTNFPYENEDINRKKHAKRPEHIRDIAFMNMPVIANGETRIFEIGNNYAEENYPYYHILQNAQVIRKRGRGTTKSRGSEHLLEPAKRDYERVSFNGKTFSKEYAKNVRGQRSLVGSATRYVYGGDGKIYKLNADANYYYNKHYKYIDRILDAIIPYVAQQNGLRVMRKKETSLEDDYNQQDIVSIFDSFN